MKKNHQKAFQKQKYFLASLFALDLGNVGEGPGFGRFPPDKVTDFKIGIADVVSLFVGFLTIISGIWFIIKLILGAFSWISAGGNPDSLQKARQAMVDALIGIIIVVGAIALISIVGTVLGLDILNIGKLLKNLTGGVRPEEPPFP